MGGWTSEPPPRPIPSPSDHQGGPESPRAERWRPRPSGGRPSQGEAPVLPGAPATPLGRRRPTLSAHGASQSRAPGPGEKQSVASTSGHRCPPPALGTHVVKALSSPMAETHASLCSVGSPLSRLTTERQPGGLAGASARAADPGPWSRRVWVCVVVAMVSAGPRWGLPRLREPVWGKRPPPETGVFSPSYQRSRLPLLLSLRAGARPRCLVFTSDTGGLLGGTPCSTQEAPCPAPLPDPRPPSPPQPRPALPGWPLSPPPLSLVSAGGEKFWSPNAASLLRMEPNATSLAASGS